MDMNGSTKQSSAEQKPLWKQFFTVIKNLPTRIYGKLGQLVSLHTFLAVTIGLLLLHLFGLISLPFAPFVTTGRIYVDSPEVYTRERLVNDRYDQDFWLRQQLKKLEGPDVQLVRERSTTSAKAGAGEPDSADNNDGSAKADQENRLTFDQEFRIIAGIRDMIRQQVLENMLDDRHDLSGNSVYGLKFDTTVIPGSNTRQRAFVHVVVNVDNLFSKKNDTGQSSDPINGYLISKIGQQQEIEFGAIRDFNRKYIMQDEYYRTWLTDIAQRLNRMEDSVFENIRHKCPSPSENGQDFYNELTRRTLEIVLGITQERFSKLNENSDTGLTDGWVVLPDPWAKYFMIERTRLNLHGDHSCEYRVWFNVNEMSESIIALKKSSSETEHIDTASADSEDNQKSNNDDSCTTATPLTLIGESEDSKWMLYVTCSQIKLRDKIFGTSMTTPTKFPLIAGDITRLLDNHDACVDSGLLNDLEGPHPCEFELRSGFFNFSKQLSALDAYSYAIFPKNDVVGILARTSAQLSANASGAGFLSVAKNLNGSTTASVLVGYGDGKEGDTQKENRNNRSIAFGWVISARGDMQPTQKNQLALVSVPAWTNELHLSIDVGWLDRQGNPISEDGGKFDLTIPVPPDFEAFDSIFRKDAWVTRKPRIQNEEMDNAIYVKARETASIIIPGTRLWRSASVTLGAQLAERIRVLPNMEGIIAEFGPVELPYASYQPESDTRPGGSQDGDSPEECEKHGKLESRPVRLRVWTSEGMIRADSPVCVFYDPVAEGIK